MSQFRPRPYARRLPRLLSWLNGVLLRGHHTTLVVGDSHVAFAGRHALPVDAAFMGVPGDDCAALLYRIARGEFRRVTCDTLIVVLGENVVAPWCHAEEAARAVYTAALTLGDTVGARRILLHGAFPYALEAFNRALASYCDNTDVFYVAPLHAFSTVDGVHLDADTYHRWMRYLPLDAGTAKTLPAWLWRLIDLGCAVKAHALP